VGIRKCGVRSLGAHVCRAGARHAAGAGALSTHQRASQSRLQDGRQRATTYLRCARVRCGRARPTLLQSTPAGAGVPLSACRSWLCNVLQRLLGSRSPPGTLSFSADEPGSPSTPSWWLPSAASTPFWQTAPTLWVLHAPSPLLPISTDSGRSRGVILLASSASTLPLSLCGLVHNSVSCDGAIGQGMNSPKRALGTDRASLCAAVYLAVAGAGACWVHQVKTCKRRYTRPSRPPMAFGPRSQSGRRTSRLCTTRACCLLAAVSGRARALAGGWRGAEARIRWGPWPAGALPRRQPASQRFSIRRAAAAHRAGCCAGG